MGSELRPAGLRAASLQGRAHCAARFVWILVGFSVLTAALPSGAFAPGASVYLEAQTGAAFNGYNDVRIPPDTGTEFSLTDDLESDPAAFFRLRAGVVLGERHDLSLLVAPLRIEARGTLDRDLAFNGGDFPAGARLEALYRFDSYRLTYLYGLWRSPRARFDLGLTAKIRDAAIRVSGAGVTEEKTNTGFVPLIAFRFAWEMGEGWGLLFRGDALASPTGEGRAEDVFLGVVRRLGTDWSGLLGYRLLEGGADVEEVYNFALVHYASLGIRYAP